MSKKALIAMSGGVDSSVAALIMKNNQYECIGATMILADEKIMNSDAACCNEENIADAKKVCERLSMEHFVYDFSSDFQTEVIDRFVCAYKCGETPNPCVDCNRYIKWGLLFEKCEELGCEKIVTGHYAQVVYDEDSRKWLLKKGLDHSKDQSYVLYSLTQKQLEKIALPLGGMSKDEVRNIAEESGFVNSHKKDSQDICFVPDGDYAKFIEDYTNETFPQGDYVDKSGNPLGKHQGIIRYTRGQRKGLGIALGKRTFVLDVNVAENKVVLGENEDLFSRELIAEDINLISIDKITDGMKVKAKIRYNHTEADASVYYIDDNSFKVIFDEPQRAITKGQAVVLYDGDTVIGGGKIVNY